MEQLRYPNGKFLFEGMSAVQMEKWISEVEKLPGELRAAIEGLDDEQLDTHYRTGGWTVRQVVHHLADASMNMFSRFKLALTESNPTIKPFDEDRWVNTADSLRAAPDSSLLIIDGLHTRTSQLLRSLERADFEKQFYHPEKGSQMKLSFLLAYMAWHGSHHVAHIMSLRERMEW
ncbi:putative metal-dependent hydrolase [Paenibacillus sp. 1011MAR3C5]|uniref:YfiT family bacillithiol transferase n=1 Tax=Paenibacillus sp. 1011MAR3C5 TaxID=1675787 RepID=UPI000E6CBA0E|nr:putative metal-dependent hydrolase [Paenibacillus sp. 1011MAR3C5]RJE90560.1 putative metal-dependent hydrolase [Paenibacillus sp. 1011MAR3C5]